MRAGTLEAFVNGASVGVLFEGLPTRDPDVELYAAFGFESTLDSRRRVDPETVVSRPSRPL